MKLQAPGRETTGVWDEASQRFVDQPEPPSRWIGRALFAVYGTEPRRNDIIDPRLVLGLDVRAELLKEVQLTFLLNDEPTMIYGAKVEFDPDLPVPFEVRWTTPREQIAERAHQLLAERGML